MHIIVCALGCSSLSELSAQTLVVRGRVVDGQTGEVLSDANVFDYTSGVGVSTNSYGMYSISLEKGNELFGVLFWAMLRRRIL